MSNLDKVTKSETVSEWLLWKHNWASFQLCHGGNKLHFRFVLDQHATLDFYSARSLKQQFTGRKKFRSVHCGHIILNPSKPLFYSLWFDPNWGPNPRSIAIMVSMLTITPSKRLTSETDPNKQCKCVNKYTFNTVWQTYNLERHSYIIRLYF